MVHSEWEPENSVLTARVDMYIYIYIYISKQVVDGLELVDGQEDIEVLGICRHVYYIKMGKTTGFYRHFSSCYYH